MLHRIYNIPLCCFGQLSTTNNGYSLYLRFVACHLSKWIKSLWLILIPQLASTLWGEQARMLFLSQITTKSL